MLDKMPGDLWQKFANLRALYAYQIGHPGKKMLFMGGEFGQWREWTEKRSLDWHLVEQHEEHQKLHQFVRQLNALYLEEPALYEEDNSWEGFTWLDLNDAQRSILSFIRYSKGAKAGANAEKEGLIVACNFTPVVREKYRLGVPQAGSYRERLNSDSADFGGSGLTNPNLITTSPTPWHSQPHSIEFTLPPLAVVFLKAEKGQS
jgi:1,4-alpha-glucan branching enzyme